ncbi:hypothetical protein B0J18DRAFT_446029 [Chaetomium sp. MPI-SDFR-AT-0129]|nr:hypothetical protein B0J18DRAFT_446029 [Chaetomium sp. MPI-SDFR-AT-0129]
MCFEWKNRFTCGHIGFNKVERCNLLGTGCYGPDGTEKFLEFGRLCYDCNARLLDPIPRQQQQPEEDQVGERGYWPLGRRRRRRSGHPGTCRKRNAAQPSGPGRATRSSARVRSQTGGGGNNGASSASSSAAVPHVYRQMVAEARREIRAQELDDDDEGPERPVKRRRPGEGRPARRTEASRGVVAEPGSRSRVVGARPGVSDDGGDDSDADEGGDADVVLPPPTVQTVTRDSDDDEDEDDEEDIEFEDVAIDRTGSSSVPKSRPGQSTELNLDLSAQLATQTALRQINRRKAISREEKARRIEVHKVHLVCLLAHVEIRNRWCNDEQVHEVLRSLLPQKTVGALIPRASLNQFGRSESLRKGLQEAKDLFKSRFTITERGLRRALWAEDEEQLKNYQPPDDIDSTLEKSDFLEAAKTLRGSRDVGAQLFCALLRSVGVEARLVCSLQPLSCSPGAPAMPKPKSRKTQTPQKQPSRAEIYAAALARHETRFPEFQAGATTPSPRRRLGHPNAAAYTIPSLTPPAQPPSPRPAARTKAGIRGESPFPVYWVEVLDAAHQKWHPVDPLVTLTQWKPRVLEPPASDSLNALTYVIAFEADASARDVTRRYAKAYTSKTCRQRIDNPSLPPTTTPNGCITDGSRWYRALLARYTRRRPTDLDQIELVELAAAVAREPMPRNVADFKDHPIYALERHLRRGEVLAPGAQTSGTVRAGAKAPLERIYRRRDVHIARTRERWYRMGRVVKVGEEPVKSVPKRRVRKRGMGGIGVNEDIEDDDNDDVDDPDKVGLFGDLAHGNTPLYTESQTDLYTAPPVVAGRVPKNKFGNLDLYVPSMVPRGGAHIRHDRAAQAAFIAGVDYAPALTGFEFRGRQGTAVLSGVVVPEECAEGVWAVIRGLEGMEEEEERERRVRRAMRMWSWFLKGLRIRERIWAGVDEEGEEEGLAEGNEGVEGDDEEGSGEDKGKGKEVLEDMDVDIEDVSEEEGGGGGFFVPDEDDDDDDGGGGFIIDPFKPHVCLILQTLKNMDNHKPPPPTPPPTTPVHLPLNWPSHIPYLTRPSYSRYLTPAHLRALRTRPAADSADPLPVIPRSLRPGPCTSVCIVPITDLGHPANGQAGLFATRDLAPGELILPYIGEVHIGTAPFGHVNPDKDKHNDQDNKNNDNNDVDAISVVEDQDDPYDYATSDYDLWIDRESDLAVDAARAGNEARFINDYRGVPGPDQRHQYGNSNSNFKTKKQKRDDQKAKAKANAEFRTVWDPRTGERGMAVFVLPAGKKATGRARVVGIARGEEVLVSYGRGFWQGRRGDEGDGGDGGDWNGDGI